MCNPDLKHPRNILTEAVRLARETNQADLGAEAEGILAALAQRDTRAAAVT
jgi:hypothetical protein